MLIVCYLKYLIHVYTDAGHTLGNMLLVTLLKETCCLEYVAMLPCCYNIETCHKELKVSLFKVTCCFKLESVSIQSDMLLQTSKEV